MQLGVPPTADVGDVLETLLKLYPKLQHHVASDRRVVASTMTLFLHEQGAQIWRRGRAGCATARGCICPRLVFRLRGTSSSLGGPVVDFPELRRRSSGR